MSKKKSNFVRSKTKPEAQIRAIRASYAKKKVPAAVVVHPPVDVPVSKHISAPYPHFRYYKKSGHPALIVGEQPVDEYRFRKVMHDEYDGDRRNEKVIPNPDKSDSQPMYIGKRVRHDKKTRFANKPYSWKYPSKKKK